MLLFLVLRSSLNLRVRQCLRFMPFLDLICYRAYPKRINIIEANTHSVFAVHHDLPKPNIDISGVLEWNYNATRAGPSGGYSMAGVLLKIGTKLARN